jgi:hypothetical protein
VRIVREHYVRDDIYCQSKTCKVCKHTNPVLPTAADTNHYLVVDLETLVTFLELFEQPEFNNMIVAQTVLTEVRPKIPSFFQVAQMIHECDFYLFF